MTEQLDFVGHSIHNVDGLEKIRGGIGYPAEIRVAGMLHGKILRSPRPHARIVRLDTSRAEKYPGVAAVVTWTDFPKVPYHPKIGVDPYSPTQVRDCLVLEDRVRYVGDEVAAVAATSTEIAEEALELITVEYEDLPVIVDPEDALKEGRPLIHPPKSNLAASNKRGWGDIELGFKEADHIFEGTYRTHRANQFPLETHVCLCIPDSLGNLVVHSSTQMIHGLRERLSTVLEIPLRKIRVVRPNYIGGAFGSKLDMNPVEPLCVMLALKARQPVRIQLSRKEEFLTTSCNPTVMELRSGLRRDGTFTARYCKVLADAGAHTNHAASVCGVAASAFLSSYRSTNSVFENLIAYTNSSPAGAYRGYGGPQGLLGVEQHIDEISQELGIDPVDLRIKNAWRNGEPNPRTDGRTVITGYGFEECLRRGAEKFGWAGLSKPSNGKSGTLLRGVGLACMPMHGSGIIGKPGGSLEVSGAMMKLGVDGIVEVTLSTIDQGGSQNTILTQIIAEVLGAHLEDVSFSYADTDVAPVDAPTHATRVTYIVGGVVKAAAESMKQQMMEVAAKILDSKAEDLQAKEGKVFVEHDPNRSTTFAEIARKSQFAAPGRPILSYQTQISDHIPCPSGAQFVEVEVDSETGRIRIIRSVAIYDVGKAINPANAEGQIEGALAQGFGFCLSEHLKIDEAGQPHATDLADYKMFSGLDASRAEIILVENPEPTGPFGAKGLSELPICPPAPAVANALYNATGVRIRELPLTPEAVLKALQGSQRAIR